MAARAIHPVLIQAVTAGALVGDTLEPTRSAGDRARLLRNARLSAAALEAAGFEKTCGVIAGLDSCSSWIHPTTGERARVAVRYWNLPLVEQEAR